MMGFGGMKGQPISVGMMVCNYLLINKIHV